MRNKMPGFTLIELIIGITILSLLAVALLAALDPVEQFNKARDTATRNTAMEIHNALLRYNAAQDALPTEIVTGVANGSTIAPTIIYQLVQSGELKSSFTASSGTALNQIALYNSDGTASGLKSCYRPKSKQFSMAKNNYVITPGAGNSSDYLVASAMLPAAPVVTCSPLEIRGNGCLWCAQ